MVGAEPNGNTESDSTTRHVSRRLIVAIGTVVVATFMSLALRAAIAPFPRYETPHDDGLQVSTAASLLTGHWLGPWNERVLSKGAGYPLFLWFVEPTGLPPTVVQHLIYLAGALLLFVGLWRLLGSPTIPAIVFVVAAFNPVMYTETMSRVYREGLIAALAMFTLGAAVVFASLLIKQSRSPWWWVALAATTLALGASLAGLSITRADTFWIWGLTFTIPILIGWLIAVNGKRWPRFLLIGGAAAMAVLMTGAATFTIGELNERKYDVNIVDDYATGNFATAMKTWSTVNAGEPLPSIGTTKAQREAVYAISPTANKLRAAIEAHPFKNTFCRVYPNPGCQEFGGFWPWVVRKAAATELDVNSAQKLQTVFAQINSEIEAACASGKLVCDRRANVSPGVASPLSQPPATIGENLWDVFRTDLTMRNQIAVSTYARGVNEPAAPDVMDDWRLAVNGLPPIGGAPNPAAIWSVDALINVYRVALLVLLIPAAFGLAVAWRRNSRLRVLGIIGTCTLAFYAIHSAFLALYQAGAGTPAAPYQLEGFPYLVTGTTLGVVCLADWIRQKRSVPRPSLDDQQHLSASTASEQ